MHFSHKVKKGRTYLSFIIHNPINSCRHDAFKLEQQTSKPEVKSRSNIPQHEINDSLIAVSITIVIRLGGTHT